MNDIETNNDLLFTRSIFERFHVFLTILYLPFIDIKTSIKSLSMQVAKSSFIDVQ